MTDSSGNSGNSVTRRDLPHVIEQAEISFDGRTIQVVKLADGRIAAVFSSLCAALDLDRSAQARRVRSEHGIARALIPAVIHTRGGPQSADVLLAWAIPTWLDSINTHVRPIPTPIVAWLTTIDSLAWLPGDSR